jgi:hypothetical protein
MLVLKRPSKRELTSSDGMVDVLASKASVERRVGSSPTLRTKCFITYGESVKTSHERAMV